VTLAEWASNTVRDIRRDGIDGARNAATQLRLGAFRRLDWFDEGTNVYDREWDLLIVLDACRYDLMAEVANEYDYVESFGSHHSVGSGSGEWMRRTFRQEYRREVERTVYVCGNPHSAMEKHCPERDAFRVLDEVWRYAWDENLGTIRPTPLTDRAIALHREHRPERMLVHYMQPHHPFLPNPLVEEAGASDNVWTRFRKGALDRETVWAHYRDCLRYVLDRLPTLLRNVDADRVAITSDHGNLLGEWGLYGHDGKIALQGLRKVPWCVTSASDAGENTPTVEPSASVDPGADADADGRVAERLEDLGYQ
jgi:hypothetical protein